MHTQEVGRHKGKALTQRSSYLPFVPFDPFPSTLFIVSFTLLRPVAEMRERGDGVLINEALAQLLLPGNTALLFKASLNSSIIKTAAHVLQEVDTFNISDATFLELFTLEMHQTTSSP